MCAICSLFPSFKNPLTLSWASLSEESPGCLFRLPQTGLLAASVFSGFLMHRNRVSGKQSPPRGVPAQALQLATIEIPKNLASVLEPQGENVGIQHFEDRCVTSRQCQCQMKAIQMTFDIFIQTKCISWIVNIRRLQVNKDKTLLHCAATCAHSAHDPCSD